MRRSRPFWRRPRVVLILALVMCLGVVSLVITVQSESDPQSTSTSQATTQPTQSTNLYEQVQAAVADVDPIANLPDLREHPAGPERKQAFLELLVPIVEAENARIAAQRQWLEALRSRQESLSSREAERVASLCDEYALECGGDEIPARLLKRVNQVPLPLAVIQAVEESGWGTSRFARQGNNLFGIRCFSKGCGLAQRGSGRQYRAFDSVQQAVRTYLHNLNTHDAYQELRDQRAELARRGDKVTAEQLIDALENYAVREDYQDVLLALLRSNDQLIEKHRSDDTV